MSFGYLISLQLDGRRAVVVGGGPVAAARVADLRRAGAAVTVVTPAASAELRKIAGADAAVTIHDRAYLPGDLDGATIAVATREDPFDVDTFWAESRDRNVLASVLDDLPHCDFAAPALVRRGDLQIAIGTSGRAPALAKRLRRWLEDRLGDEHGDLVDLAADARAAAGPRPVPFAEWAGRWEAALADLDGLAAMVRTGRHDEARGRILNALGVGGARPGHVHLVGAGPGDPGLLTLKGAALLATADLVAYDKLAPAALLDLVPPHAERICVGKTITSPGWRQADTNQLLVTAAAEGKAVVRLKGGDPFVFGRGGEEAIACREAGIPVEIVSGVSSAIAAPAAAGVPVTHRGVATGVAIVTGHEDPTKPDTQIDWEALARFHGTLVFLMGIGHVAEIARRLVAHGRRPDTPVALVRWGTTAQQEVLTADLASIAAEVARTGFAAPATIVVGDVVRLRELIAGLPLPVLTAA
jgi:uroporphyrin-III C-methyltransferase